ncbi:M10 family metallopeptidase C-terminal domain-containing protein, partial [Microvirga sp. 2YAF29]|uniref:M10 family metallopeptidase C-terminal domain-containing protein n=1 Tax=Microvirga sp. 2YAF29 TaxID=3233031 RepID=UPI003F9AFB71
MSWISDAFRSAGDWVVNTVRDIADGIGGALDSAWNWVSDNISGLPLQFFSAMGTAFPSWTIGGAKYFVPNHADSDVNALMSGTKWGGETITYAMPDSRSDYSLINPSADGFKRLSTGSEGAVRDIMDVLVAGYVNKNVAYSGRGDANIQVAGFEPGSVINRSHGYYPGVPAYGGETWLTNGEAANVKKGSHDYLLVMHELGHSLGLKHTHDHADKLPKMSGERDSTEFTVMSYNETVNRPQSFMQYDIAALQMMYGADFTTNSGNTTYSWKQGSGETRVNGISQGQTSSETIFLTLWDGGGIDTYDMSAFSDNAVIDITPGGSSSFSNAQLAKKDSTGAKVKGNVYNAFLYGGDLRSLIENAIGGSGNDRIIGNQAANVLQGRDGNDILDSGAGNDTLYGGAGDDILYGGAGADILVGGAGLGDMAAYAATNGQGVTVNLANPQFNTGEAKGDTYDGIENIAGTQYTDILTGDAKNNILYGLGSDDILRGGLLGSDDILRGGL